MRYSMTLVTILIGVFFSVKVQAEAVDIVASAHGSTCDEAKAALMALVSAGPDTYSTEQSNTHQFPTGAAAVKYCENLGASTPFATIPDINDKELFPLPTETKVVGSKCSTSSTGGSVTYGVGWMGSSACNM